VACPDDGTEIGVHDTQPSNVHVAETLLLPGRQRPWDEKPTVTVDGMTRVDAIAFGREDSDTKLRVEEVLVNDVNPFDPNDSDMQTVAATDRMREPLSPPPEPRGPGSSDPPTSARRRYDDHIDLPSGSIVSDEYEIANRLGQGAMGEVYAARHIKLNKRVAIKVISPRLSEDTAAIERFEQDARTLAEFHHPGIVDVLGFGELADGRAYFVMEFLAGESVDDRLGCGRIPFDEALDIFDQVARALEAAHLHGVIHRDLKPANVYLVRIPNEPPLIVKLLDFGLAKLAVDVDQRAERTQSGAVIGTPTHLSPEQARGPDVDHRTDIYALGCTAYQLLLGRPPFEDAKTIAALIAAHIHETRAMPRAIWPEIPPQLDLLLFAMLSKDPAHRPTLTQTRHVIASVKAIASTRPRLFSLDGVRAMTAPVAPRSSNVTTFVIAGAAMIAGIVIGAAALGSRSSGDERETPLASLRAERADAGRAAAALTNAVDAQVDSVVSQSQPVGTSIRVTPIIDPRVPDPSLTNPPTVAAPTATTVGTVGTEHRSVGPLPAPARPQAIGDGVLRLVAKPSCDIVVDGKSTGLRTPQVGIKLAAGRHRITLLNDKYGIKETFIVEIKPRETVTQMKDYSDHMVEKKPEPATTTINPSQRKPGQ
jgi:serine/threonine protein kinase